MAVTPVYGFGTRAGHVEGTWTHTVGSAAETLVVNGTPTNVSFVNQDADSKYDVAKSYSTATSGSVTTITIGGDATVTLGSFVVDYIPV